MRRRTSSARSLDSSNNNARCSGGIEAECKAVLGLRCCSCCDDVAGVELLVLEEGSCCGALLVAALSSLLSFRSPCACLSRNPCCRLNRSAAISSFPLLTASLVMSLFIAVATCLRLTSARRHYYYEMTTTDQRTQQLQD